MEKNKESEKKAGEDPAGNNNKQSVDKSPGEERRKGEKVTLNDLRGKKVDGFPSTEEDKPIDQ